MTPFPPAIRLSLTGAILLLAALLVLAAGARADVPACAAVAADPTIPTCTCVCDQSSISNSNFPACAGLQVGDLGATPGSCPDMLLGRRVLSRGDALAVADPHNAGDGKTNARTLLYQTENNSSNAGIGTVVATPVYTETAVVDCLATGDTSFPQQTRFARLFDLKYEMLVNLRPTTDSSQYGSTCEPATNESTNLAIVTQSDQAGAPVVPPYRLHAFAEWVQLAVDDFNYDGYDDLVFLNRDILEVFTAADIEDPAKGLLHVGTASTITPSGAYRAPLNEPATGDFNGDGLIDVAWIGGDFPNESGSLSIFFATVCPGDVPDTICAGAAPFHVIIDPAGTQFGSVSGASSTIVLEDASLAKTDCGVLSTDKNLQVAGPGVYRAGAIALGNFEDDGIINIFGAPIDELVVTYVSGSTGGGGSSPCSVDVQYYSFSTPTDDTPVWAAQRGATVANLLPDATQPGAFIMYQLYSRAAYLDWYGNTEQVATAMSASLGFRGLTGNTSYWRPMTVAVAGSGKDAKLAVCAARTGNEDDNGSTFWGVAAGRFSTSTPSTSTSDSGACADFSTAAPGDCPYNLEMAVLLGVDNTSPIQPRTTLELYTVEASQPEGSDSGKKCYNDASVAGYLPSRSAVTNNSDYVNLQANSRYSGSMLRAGDAFGESVRVGSPTVTRVDNHSEPQFIIQTPPTLLDYVQPNPQDSKVPAVVNFTQSPIYNTQIQYDASDANKSSASSTHSFSFSDTVSFSGEVKFPNSYVGTVDIKNKESYEYYKQKTNSEQLGITSTKYLETGAVVKADDQVWFTTTKFNVFNFPVLGQTTCPASLTCNDSTPGCPASAYAVPMTCEPEGDGCHCLAAKASASDCPTTLPGAGALECSGDGDEVCCSMLQTQSNVSFSGPEEVSRVSTGGSSIEWYQPKHEPGQILSYPSSNTLALNRTPAQNKGQLLAELDSYDLGPNDHDQTIKWTCSTNSSVSTGTTTRHNFESDTSITVGMNNLKVQPLGVNVGVDYDYQSSASLASLNSYTSAQTSSKSVKLNLAGAGFLDIQQYGYQVQGMVVGAYKPASVFDEPPLTVCPSDNPECSQAQQAQADCTTTGPITVAYAADPTVGTGVWWQSSSPYLYDVDIALNNPQRWRSVPASTASNQALQCRGTADSSACYASNQPQGTSASDVWDASFYNMKGLFATIGNVGGPLRNSAAVGDEIFLQARVYNYSLKNLDPDSKVYVRFYRQQLDVNNDNGSLSVVDYAVDGDNKPLPAVVIGKNGPGDITPIEVAAPSATATGNIATVWSFNNTSDPDLDNISLATTSYIPEPDDACEYDNGLQVCEGAYYAYWVVAWAEDANGVVLSERDGHGLGSGFDPDTPYGFITDVPLEMVGSARQMSTYANNVGMYKLVFSIVPKSDSQQFAAGIPTLDRVAVSREKAVLGEPVVISAQVRAGDGPSTGNMVTFYDGEPLNGGQAFDVEWLPTIRAADRHFVRVNYTPESCGLHDINVELTGGSRSAVPLETVLVDVGIDADAAIDSLQRQVAGLTLNFPGNAGSAHKQVLTEELQRAQEAFAENRVHRGVLGMQQFDDHVGRLSAQMRLPAETADALLAQSAQIVGCVP